MFFGKDKQTEDKETFVKILTGDFSWKEYGNKLKELYPNSYGVLMDDRDSEIEKKRPVHNFDKVADLLNLEKTEVGIYQGYLISEYTEHPIENALKNRIIEISNPNSVFNKLVHHENRFLVNYKHHHFGSEKGTREWFNKRKDAHLLIVIGELTSQMEMLVKFYNRVGPMAYRRKDTLKKFNSVQEEINFYPVWRRLIKFLKGLELFYEQRNLKRPFTNYEKICQGTVTTILRLTKNMSELRYIVTVSSFHKVNPTTQEYSQMKRNKQREIVNRKFKMTGILKGFFSETPFFDNMRESHNEIIKTREIIEGVIDDTKFNWIKQHREMELEDNRNTEDTDTEVQPSFLDKVSIRTTKSGIIGNRSPGRAQNDEQLLRGKSDFNPIKNLDPIKDVIIKEIQDLKQGIQPTVRFGDSNLKKNESMQQAITDFRFYSSLSEIAELNLDPKTLELS